MSVGTVSSHTRGNVRGRTTVAHAENRRGSLTLGEADAYYDIVVTGATVAELDVGKREGSIRTDG